MAEWIIVVLTALGLIGSIVVVLVKVSTALTKNAIAVDRLTDVMDKQDAKLNEHNELIGDHEVRISNMETIHKLRGCDGENPQRGIE